MILIWQNDQLPPHEQFIISDLDSRHLLVKTSEIESIEQALNTEVSSVIQIRKELYRVVLCSSFSCLGIMRPPSIRDRTDSSDVG